MHFFFEVKVAEEWRERSVTGNWIRACGPRIPYLVVVVEVVVGEMDEIV